MKHSILAACLVLASGVAYAAVDDSSSAVQMDLGKVFTQADKEKRSPTEEEIMVLVDRCRAIYDQSAGEDEEMESLHQIVRLSNYASGTKIEDAWLEAVKLLTKDFVDDPRLAELVYACPSPKKLVADRDRMFAEVEQKTQCVDVKAAFAYKKLGPLIQKADDGQLDEKATKAFFAQLEELAKTYGEAKVPFEGVTYTEWVKTRIYAMEHLKIGAVAPDIVGKDLDGVDFKLSDYRGKVVMLDFWGYW